MEESLGDSFMKAPAVILIFLENGADHFAGIAFYLFFSPGLRKGRGEELKLYR